MPNGDLYEAAERARQMSETFLNRSREQMVSSFSEQRAMAVGAPPGMASAAATAAGGGVAMLAGTPAGRLLDTINQLIRTGAGAAGGVMGGPVMTAAGGMGAIAQGAGGGAAFMMGNAPFGPAGMGGGAMLGAQNRMGFWQMAFTGYGEGLPFGLGRYAAQRLDMTQQQAQQMAREEMSYRMYGGGMKGIQAAWNLSSFGLSNFMLRREGLSFETFRQEDFNRSIQANMRFTTRETLARAGMQQYAGAFATGITRAGARFIGEDLRGQLGQLEAETGASPQQLLALQGRAMGTLGATGLNRLLGRGRDAFTAGVAQETRSVREIQQILNLSEEEADQFFRTMGQMHGTATRIAGLARNAQRAAGQMGMDVRDVFGIVTNFETMGRQMMIGQGRTGATGLRMGQQLRGWQMQGLMSPEEAMMYGGATPEQGLQIMTQRMFEMGVGQFEQGRMGGLETLMRYRPGTFNRFMGGGMGFLQAMGAAGGAVIRDPLMQMRQRYDPASRAMAGEEGMRTMYQRVQSMRANNMFLFNRNEADVQVQMLREFETSTGLAPMEARRWFDMFGRESRALQSQIRDVDINPKDRKLHEQNIMQLHHRLRSEGLLGIAMQGTGLSEFEAVGDIYRRNLVNGKFDVSKLDRTSAMVRDAFVAREKAAGAAGFQAMVGQGTWAGTLTAAQNAVLGAGTRRGRAIYEDTAAQRMRSWWGEFTQRDVKAGRVLFRTELTGQNVAQAAELFTAAGGAMTPEELGARLFGREARMAVTPEGAEARAWTSESYGGRALEWLTGYTKGGKRQVMGSVNAYDPATGLFRVDIGGVRKNLSWDDLTKQYPELAQKVASGIQANVGGLDLSKIKDMFLERGNTAIIERNWNRMQGERFKQRFAGIAGYMFGPGAEKWEWSRLATAFRGLAPGDQRLSMLEARAPEAAQLLKTIGGGGGIEDIRKFLGDEGFFKAVEEITGMTTKEIKQKMSSQEGMTKFFNQGMVDTLIGHIMTRQDFENVPIGSDAASAMFVQFAENTVNSLAQAIANAISGVPKKK